MALLATLRNSTAYGPLAPIIKAEPLNAPVSLTFPHGALLLLLFLKERLLDFSVIADQPFFGMSGTVPKIICVCLKFARSFLGCPQPGRKTVGKIHGSVAVCLRQIRRFLHQGDNPMSGVIRHHSGIRRPVFRGERNNRSWCFACLNAHHCSSRSLKQRYARKIKSKTVFWREAVKSQRRFISRGSVAEQPLSSPPFLSPIRRWTGAALKAGIWAENGEGPSQLHYPLGVDGLESGGQPPFLHPRQRGVHISGRFPEGGKRARTTSTRGTMNSVETFGSATRAARPYCCL